jgi:RNA polymerase-binding transcription factor DksA
MPDPMNLRSQLLGQRALLEGRLRRIRADRTHSERPPERRAEDRAIQAENDEVLDRLDRTVQAELDAIDAALERMRLGHFGRCVRCSRPIRPERLRALPTAAECGVCASGPGGA